MCLAGRLSVPEQPEWKIQLQGGKKKKLCDKPGFITDLTELQTFHII